MLAPASAGSERKGLGVRELRSYQPSRYCSDYFAHFAQRGMNTGLFHSVVNLAAALRKKGKSVLLIDIDSQSNTTFATGLIKFQFEEDDNLRDSNIYHVLESGDFNFIQNIARQSHYFNNPEIEIIPSHINLIEGQYKLNQIGASKTRLVTKFKK